MSLQLACTWRLCVDWVVRFACLAVTLLTAFNYDVYDRAPEWSSSIWADGNLGAWDVRSYFTIGDVLHGEPFLDYLWTKLKWKSWRRANSLLRLTQSPTLVPPSPSMVKLVLPGAPLSFHAKVLPVAVELFRGFISEDYLFDSVDT